MVSTSQQDFLPSIQDNEFLPPISRWSTLGGLFIVGSMGVAIALASVFKYNVTVKAAANVRPAGELRLVQATTEGQVTDIFVKENQPVNQGDVIATIDDSRLQTQKRNVQSSIQQAQLQLTQINAQIRAIDSHSLAETDRINRAVTSAEAELTRRRRDYQDQQITTTADVAEAEANVRLSQEELQKAQVQLQSAQADLNSTIAALNAAQAKFKRYQPIAEFGALSQNQLEEAKLAVTQQQQAVKSQQAAVEVQKQTIEQQYQTVAAAKARLKRALAMLNPTQADVAIAQQRIPQEKAMGEATLATLTRERDALIQQRIDMQKQLERDTHSLKQAEIDLSQTLIKAPTDGILFKLNLRNSSQTVRPGEEIAQLAPTPSNTTLVVKALVAAQDIGKVKTNQKAQLRISACPYPDYGTLNGVVSTISPDAITPPGNEAAIASNPTRNSAFFEVTIKPETLSLRQGNNYCPIQLGMEGTADIISRQETVIQFLLRKARLMTDL
jgi:multidrug efflux pump subunit AcrA (membrane-fusion protein)